MIPWPFTDGPMFVDPDPQTWREAEEWTWRDAQSCVVRGATRCHKAWWARIDAQRQQTPRLRLVRDAREAR